ncbi:hypothetical protein RRG08_014191 [Elysia crispata]|uniref:Uncharacterized protein n=1 Tax=Elysia crispata TaxID=231223 RepID=A0AAE0Z2V9_9GAST|nr:hypothetical protein RRG08_014191 [Elysia crispata]
MHLNLLYLSFPVNSHPNTFTTLCSYALTFMTCAYADRFHVNTSSFSETAKQRNNVGIRVTSTPYYCYCATTVRTWSKEHPHSLGCCPKHKEHSDRTFLESDSDLSPLYSFYFQDDSATWRYKQAICY